VGTNLKRLNNLPSTKMCLSFTTVSTATEKLSLKKKKQTANYILSSKKSNKYHKIYADSFWLFLFKKIRFHHETIQSLLNFPVLFDGEAQLPLRTQFVNETYIKCKNNYFLLIFFQKKIISPPKLSKKKCFQNASSNSQPETKITSG